TFVRLGALTGACAALRVAATVCVAGYCAWVRPAVAAGCALTGAERRERQATNGSGYRSSARQREPGAAPSPPGKLNS
ncbi:MAG: hypothetical protein II622_00805, partial [Thermoguttaceae bacterium]|nr:hypothetical protein [Thermoguttaceae bacterium]